MKLTQLAKVGFLSRPTNAQSSFIVLLWNQVEMDMVHNLVGNSSVVLQDIVATSLWGIVLVKFQDLSQSLHHWQNVSEILIWKIVQLGPVVLWNNKTVGLSSRLDIQEGVSELGLNELERRNLALDNLAEDARGVRCSRHSID